MFAVREGVRKSLFGDAGEDEFALGEDFSGFRVDNFRDKVVYVDMQPGLLLAFKGNAGAGKLGQAVNDVRLDAQAFLNAFAHLLAPGLGPEDGRLEPVLEALFGYAFAKIDRVGGRAAHDGGPTVAHELEPALGIADDMGSLRLPTFFEPPFSTGPGEQAVAEWTTSFLSAPAATLAHAQHSSHKSMSCWVEKATTRLPVVSLVNWMRTQS